VAAHESSQQHAYLEESDGILTMTFNRPDKLNAISPQMTAQLWEAARAFGDREDLHVLVITGVGRYFTAGIDLNYPAADRRGGKLPSDITYRRTYRRHHLLYDEFEAIEKPIILAAQGGCLGAGVEMGASCDFRFAAASAFFGLPETRLGLIAGSGGTSRLTRLVGPHWAKWIAMAGEQVDAEQAKAIGYVHQVFPDETFAADVADFARRLVGMPIEALGAAKLAVDIAADVDRTTARNVERLTNTSLATRSDFAEKTASFVRPKPDSTD
jgi:enoyl-CoA hydratase/carnithine racemase